MQPDSVYETGKGQTIGHWRSGHAQKRTKRSADSNRPGHADGPDVPQLLDSGAAGGRSARERLPAGAGQAAVGAPGGLPRHRRPLRADGRVLRASRGLAVVRPQRGMRAPLRLSRLEIRRHRAVHGSHVRAGGVRWTYMGPPGAQPPLPEWEFITVPRAQTFTSKRLQESNWLQAMEGGIDSSHVSFLHRGDLNTDPLFKGAKGNQYNLSDARPVFEVAESHGGLCIGARRNAEDGHYYWRITQWVMPSFTMIAPRGNHSVHGHFWIPIDDENCWTWSFDYHPVRNLADAELAAMRDGKGIHVRYVPGTFRPLANKDNDYLIDRAAQKAGRTFSGVDGIAMQDASLQESMGPIVDRTKENLASTDSGIIMARHRLLRAVKALTDKGVVPPGVDPAHQKVRSAAIVLPPDVPFTEGAREALIAHPAVAPASV